MVHHKKSKLKEKLLKFIRKKEEKTEEQEMMEKWMKPLDDWMKGEGL
jgi:hypothetical protein